MIKSWLKIFTVCSLKFAVVNRDNVKHIVSVHRVVWAPNDVTLYRVLNVINPNNISSLRFSIHRVIKVSVHRMITIQKVTSNVQSFPASLQTFIDTPNCVLEDRVQYSTVHIPNVFCDGRLQPINCVRIFRIH